MSVSRQTPSEIPDPSDQERLGSEIAQFRAICCRERGWKSGRSVSHRDLCNRLGIGFSEFLSNPANAELALAAVESREDRCIASEASAAAEPERPFVNSSALFTRKSNPLAQNARTCDPT